MSPIITVDHNRNIKIYTAKGSSMFNQIIKSGGCCESGGVIWTTNDITKYATKVFTSMSGYTVSVHQINGEILHYGSHDFGAPWERVSNKIPLHIDNTSSKISFDYVHDGERRIFTAKPGFLFIKVLMLGTFSDHVFWEAKTDQECSSKVVVYGVESSIKNINIFQNNNQVKHFHKVKRDWITTTPFVLDIDINKNNDLFDYRSTRGFGHFNPKANLTITRIVKKELKIWSAKDNDYGLKVVLMGSRKDVKHISILLESGRFVLLSKSGKGDPWEDITQNKHNFSGVKLFSLDEGTSKYHQLTREDYEPIVFECRYGYKLKDSVKCVMITNGNMLLWNHTEDHEFGYPRGMPGSS
ncbi:hypothetical protein TpMuguga_02g00608 [Theileria parva strain Muguga]|uniref:Uncharacterized protein n=1 Tax=Theileria parva TaxID=5875 RepID=Q4N4N2_THEPA|nr:uncharacterized protein TpMuguga_02g00608 [Theileria parva strain Muguga]EAN32891.1 hypothetical protein TpMuguga_02g00608 [Theileria parva strain Muguga]|eukprot:XP_765174.1 hypothetical protein [Theileria parva strain Muguga]